MKISLKKLLENGYIIVGLRSSYSDRVEVLLTRRFPLQGERNNVSIRINRKYLIHVNKNCLRVHVPMAGSNR